MTRTETEYRQARAWYVIYPLDAYALGPYRFTNPVTADVAIEQAEEQFGEKPCGVWPDGPTEEIDEYEIVLEDLDD